MNATAERVNAVIAWFERHHPDRDLDPDLWARVLNRVDPDDITRALDRWHQTNPTTPPKPAHINHQLTQVATNHTAGTELARARRIVNDAIERRNKERPQDKPKRPICDPLTNRYRNTA